jgi:hypothetical protein
VHVRSLSQPLNHVQGRVRMVDMEVIVRRDDGPAHDHRGRAGAASMRL